MNKQSWGRHDFMRVLQHQLLMDRFQCLTLAIVLYAYCGLSMSKIARLCQVSVVAVLNWIKVAALQVEPVIEDASSNIVMIDEMWHFSSMRKKQDVALDVALARHPWRHASTFGMAPQSSWGFNLEKASGQVEYKHLCLCHR